MIDINKILEAFLIEINGLKSKAERDIIYCEGAREGAVGLAQRLIKSVESTNESTDVSSIPEDSSKQA